MRILVAGNIGYVRPGVVKALRQSHPNPRGVRVLSVFRGRTATSLQEVICENQSYRAERLIQPKELASVIVNALSQRGLRRVTDIHLRSDVEEVMDENRSDRPLIAVLQREMTR